MRILLLIALLSLLLLTAGCGQAYQDAEVPYLLPDGSVIVVRTVTKVNTFCKDISYSADGISSTGHKVKIITPAGAIDTK